MRLEPVALRLVEPAWGQRVPSPAHDSLSPEERRRIIADNPDSYLAVTRDLDDVDPETGRHPRRVLDANRVALLRLLSAGAFSEPIAPMLYLYRLALGDHSQVGVVGLVATGDYDRAVIRVHERHVERRAQLLAQQLATVQAQSSPIALAHRPEHAMTALAARTMASSTPILDLASTDGLRQQLWAIGDRRDAHQAQSTLSHAPLYLIDGHHRAAAASHHRHSSSGSAAAEWMLGVVFPIDQLQNWAFHRISHGVDADRLLSELHRRYMVRVGASSREVAERHPDELALLVGSRWYLVRLPMPGGRDPVTDLVDPGRLQHHVLGPLLDVDPADPGDRLDYVAGRGDLADLERLASAPPGITWVMRPVPMRTLMAVADAGRVLPPKSTYFVPKVRAGVFVRHLD